MSSRAADDVVPWCRDEGSEDDDEEEDIESGAGYRFRESSGLDDVLSPILGGCCFMFERLGVLVKA